MKIKSKEIVTTVLLTAMLLSANPAFAASGGRIGGGSFRSSSSRNVSPSGGYSRPSSVTRTSPSPSPITVYSPPPRVVYSPPPRVVYNSRPTTVYVEPRQPRTNIVVIPNISPQPYVNPLVYNNSPTRLENPRNSDSSFPWVFLLIICLSGAVITYLLLKKKNSIDPSTGGSYTNYASPGKIRLTRVQVALLASAKDVKNDLERMTEEGDTGSNEGLAKILQDTTLALLRHPNKTIYAFSEVIEGNPEKIESLYNHLSMEERAKISDELLSNVFGRVSSSVRNEPADEDEVGEYILVSILVATEGVLDVKPVTSAADLRQNLVALGSISPDDLVALEIIWQPEGEREVLNQEELLSLYPYLSRI